MTANTPGSFVDDARRYRLDSRIATGGMGEVWRAEDTVLGRSVAVKLLKTEYADDPAFRSRFETEARHAASLAHPNIASVYDFGEAAATAGDRGPRPFLVMELVEGQPLSALLRPGTRLDPEATRSLLAQAADGLAAAHAAGIVHRDVKPANLLVRPDRQLKVTDFGIARAGEAAAMTQTGQVLGTPQYLSPEQARGTQATPASDVYALGVVAFECLAGERPFQRESPVATALAHLHDPVPDLPGDVPPDLAAVVRRALAKDPADRFPDAAAFGAALRDPSASQRTQVVAPPAADRTQVLTGLSAAPAAAAAVPPPPTGVAAPVRREEPRARRGRWLVLALVLLGLAAVAAAVLAGRDEDAGPDPEPRERFVRIDESAYVGRPVEEVAEELDGRGFEVTTTEVANPGDENPGLVSSVDPSGRVSRGSPVAVSYWGRAPVEEPTEEPAEEPAEEPTQEEPEEPEETEEPAPSPSVPVPTAPETAVDEPGGDGPPSTPPGQERKEDSG